MHIDGVAFQISYWYLRQGIHTWNVSYALAVCIVTTISHSAIVGRYGIHLTLMWPGTV